MFLKTGDKVRVITGKDKGKEGWKKEVEMIKEHYKKFDRLPVELANQLKALEARLEK